MFPTPTLRCVHFEPFFKPEDSPLTPIHIWEGVRSRGGANVPRSRALQQSGGECRKRHLHLRQSTCQKMPCSPQMYSCCREKATASCLAELCLLSNPNTSQDSEVGTGRGPKLYCFFPSWLAALTLLGSLSPLNVPRSLLLSALPSRTKPPWHR